MEMGNSKPLLAYSREELCELLVAKGYKPFHGRQLHAWIHRRNIFDFNEMTDLSKSLRADLSASYTVGDPKVVEIARGATRDSAVKYLFELADGSRVEAVYIPAEDRTTVCLSSQVGCAFGCTFCATAKLGLTRNMTAAEIIGTFLAIRKHEEGPVSNVVFMGMGEPLANLRQVMLAWDRLVDPDGIGLSRRRVTISTVGLPDRIRQLSTEPYPPKLVFSIASPHDEVRRKLLPYAGKFPLSEIHSALTEYASKTRNWITVAVLVAEGLNDTEKDMRALHRWIGPLKAKVNLLRYNETDGELKAVDESVMNKNAAELVRHGRTVILRHSRGRNISAACGQLAAKAIQKK